MKAPAQPGFRAVETSRAARLSVASNSFLAVSKLAVGFLTGSISVIAEGLHSANDLVAALLALYSVRKAQQPADERHPYGHGKFEPLSSAVEACLIIAAAFAILYFAVRSLVRGEFETLEHGPALAMMGLSVLINILMSSHLHRVAADNDSSALRADAAHLRTDAWTSGGVFVGLGVILGVEQLGGRAHWIDPTLAATIAVLVLTQGGRLAKQALGQLVDQALPEGELEIIHEIIERHPGMFVEFHQLRTRRSGRQRHVDLHLVVRRDMTVGQAHQLADHLESDIEKSLPGAQVTIHIEPGLNAATVDDKGSSVADEDATSAAPAARGSRP